MDDFNALFPSKTLVKVLSVFMLSPEASFYQAEIAEKTGEILVKVQQALKRCVASGFVERTGRGRMVYYKANTAHPAFDELKALFLKTVALTDRVRQVLVDYQDRIHSAFIYGSFADGRATSRSDVDVFVLGDVSLKELALGFDHLARILGREVNPVVMSVEEFQRKAHEANRFAEELLTCSKIWLIGNADEFRHLAERGETPPS